MEHFGKIFPAYAGVNQRIARFPSVDAIFPAYAGVNP